MIAVWWHFVDNVWVEFDFAPGTSAASTVGNGGALQAATYAFDGFPSYLSIAGLDQCVLDGQVWVIDTLIYLCPCGEVAAPEPEPTPEPEPEGTCPCCEPVPGSGTSIAECEALFVLGEVRCNNYKEGGMCQWNENCGNCSPEPEPTANCCIPLAPATDAALCTSLEPLGEERCDENAACEWGECAGSGPVAPGPAPGHSHVSNKQPTTPVTNPGHGGNPGAGSTSGGPGTHNMNNPPIWNPCCDHIDGIPTAATCPTQYCRWSPDIPACSHISGLPCGPPTPLPMPQQGGGKASNNAFKTRNAAVDPPRGAKNFEREVLSSRKTPSNYAKARVPFASFKATPKAENRRERR
jgi:hypothetical protein